MNDSRGPWYLFTGILIGLALGVLWGWYVAPVEYTDTAPGSLRADYQDEYRTLIALAYLFNNDPARTQARISLLEDNDPAASYTALAQRANAVGRSDEEVQARSRMAALANASPSGIPTAVPLTVFPTAASLPSQTPTSLPSLTPLPAETESQEQTATSQPTATTAPTATRFPTPTPTGTPGSPFILDSRVLTCPAGGAYPNLVIRTLNASGNGVPGVEVVLNWPGNEEHLFTGLKPELGLGYADFRMSPGTTYTLRLADGSQLITDIAPEQCDPGSGQLVWGTLDITFVQP